MTSKGGPPVPASPGGRVPLQSSLKKTSSISGDPEQLLDAFDSFTSSNRRNSEAPDAIEFLNAHYNSEALLVAQLPSIRSAVGERMSRLDNHISTALQRQADSAEATQKHVQDAKASVVSLEQRIKQVQQKASQSEKTVREITKDMKRLDCAKRNLQRTITTLKRLHMLVHAVEQLRLTCLQEPHPDYKSASHLVDAIRLLLKHFDAYSNKVEPIRLLSQKVTDLQGELKFCLVRGFRIVGFGRSKTREMEKKNKYKSLMASEEGKEEEDFYKDVMTPEVMIGGTMLIDALGIEARKEFMTGFCQDHLLEYSQIYKPVKKVEKEKPRVSSFKAQPEKPKEDTKPEFALEFVEKRFVWFRNRLTEIAKKYPGVFPPYWNIEYWLSKTKNHLLALLGGKSTRDPDADDATILLKALQKTIQFEKEVGLELERSYGTVFTEPGKKNADGKGPPPKSASPKKPSGKHEGSAPTDDDSLGQLQEDGKASTEQDSVDKLLGVASSAFDNYMRPYIALEEQSMDEQLVKALEDRTVDTRGELPVFTTSTKLFVYIKGSITRCTALTRGNAFFLLYRAFQNSLRKYAQVLSSKLPPPLPQTSSSSGLSIPNVSFGKKEGNSTQRASYKVPPGEEVTVCHVIGTCEYCADTVEALEDLIRDTIEEQYQSKIDMMGQQEAFHEITAKAIRVLVTGLENRLEDALNSMTAIDWAVFDEVGEESDYVRYMHKEIVPYITMARGLIPTSYFRSVCDKFAFSFTETYYETLTKRIKKVSEPGTQQILLDVYNLKTLFLKLPVLEKSETSAVAPGIRKGLPAKSTIAPAMYTKMVQKQFKKIEILLKVAGTPVDLLIDVFKAHWPGGTAIDLQSAMSLKGMKRTEQAVMLEKFGLDPRTARKGATMNVTSSTIVTERLQAVNSDLNQMRQKVDDFRKSFR
eukprot:scaffold2751_cov131-Cylindrotheca_fusiformis.AAC.32